MRVSATAPVVALDIDGTMGKYHQHFVWFLSNIYLPGEQGGSWWPPNWDRSHEGEFSEALGMDKTLYRQAKLAYRQGGLKRSLPQFRSDLSAGGLLWHVQDIRQMGVQIWICTTRPWLRLDAIDPDTRYWIERNVGRVDGVLFGEDKYLDLIDNVGKDRILGVVDDLPENVTRADEIGLRWALRAGPHNVWWNPEVPRLGSIVDIKEQVKLWLKN